MDYSKEFDDYVLAHQSYINYVSNQGAQEVDTIVFEIENGKSLDDALNDIMPDNPLKSEKNPRTLQLSLEQKTLIEDASAALGARSRFPTEKDWKIYTVEQMEEIMQRILQIYEQKKELYINLCLNQEYEFHRNITYKNV